MCQRTRRQPTRPQVQRGLRHADEAVESMNLDVGTTLNVQCPETFTSAECGYL